MRNAMNKSNRPVFGNGFTLIELLVVLAIVAVLATMAAPTYKNIAANQVLNDTVNELQISLETARTTALSRNRRVTVAPMAGTDWTTGWRVFIDSNANGAFDDGEEQIQQREAMDSKLALFDSSITSCKKSTFFSYAADGFLAGGTAGSVPIQHSDTGRQKCVTVAAMGRPRICEVKGSTC